MFAEATAYVVTILKQAGINAATDPRDLDLPGVWVTPARASFATLSGLNATVSVDLVAITRNLGPARDMETLDELVAAASLATTAHTWEITSVTLPNHSADPLPAASTTIKVDWSK